MKRTQFIGKRHNVALACALLGLLSGLLCLTVAARVHLRPPVVAQETKVLQACKDTTLIERADGSLSNGAGPIFLVGRTGQPVESIRRGLISFDLSQIPAASRITSVKLLLSVSLSAGGGGQSGGRTGGVAEEQVSLFRLLSDWGEGKSASEGGRGAPSSEGDATWIHTFYPKSRWSKPGGDYADSESARQAVGNAGTYTWGSTPQMVADVQSWLDSPQKNFGWLLRGDETRGATARVFQSRQSQNTQARPQLIVTYTTK